MCGGVAWVSTLTRGSGMLQATGMSTCPCHPPNKVRRSTTDFFSSSLLPASDNAINDLLRRGTSEFRLKTPWKEMPVKKMLALGIVGLMAVASGCNNNKKPAANAVTDVGTAPPAPIHDSKPPQAYTEPAQ